MTPDPVPSVDARPSGGDFADAAARRQRGFIAEFFAFARSNKKWWLTPILVILLAVSLLVMLSSTAAGPFVYTLF